MQPIHLPKEITQQEYVTYQRYLKDLDVVEKCFRKKEPHRISFNGHHFEKLEKSDKNDSITNLFNLSGPGQEILKKEIFYINQIHQKLQGNLQNRKPDDCAPLVAELYNTQQKTIQRWNLHFAHSQEMQISTFDGKLDPSFATKTAEQLADEKALKLYFEYLDKYPKLRHQNDNGFTYKILYDPKDIEEVRKATYTRMYSGFINQKIKAAKDQIIKDLEQKQVEITEQIRKEVEACKIDLNPAVHSEAHEYATKASRVGVVWGDQDDAFWVVIRDAVEAPNGFRHTYNRHIWKCDLDKTGGTAVLPIINTPEGKKIVVQVAGRHAPGSLEIEIPRGAAKGNEKTPEDTARRECQEETGYQANKLFHLNAITPDAGLTASIVPVYAAEVSNYVGIKHDKTEAIMDRRYALTPQEIKQAFKQGYIEVKIKNIKTNQEELVKATVRDSFTAYALLMAFFDDLLEFPK